MKLTKEQATDVNLLLALVRCFAEQLHMIKGNHSGIIKLKFNRLLKVASQYEKEVVRLTGESEEIEIMYDNLMELITAIKVGISGEGQETEASN